MVDNLTYEVTRSLSYLAAPANYLDRTNLKCYNVNNSVSQHTIATQHSRIARKEMHEVPRPDIRLTRW